MCFYAVLGDRHGCMSLVSLRKSKLYFENKKLVSQLDFECENTSDIFSEISDFVAEVINFEPYVKILGSLSATYKKPKLAKSKGV